MNQLAINSEPKRVLSAKWSRILLVIFMSVIAIASALDAVVGATRKDSPATALFLYPNDSGANAAFAAGVAEQSQNKVGFEVAAAAAFRSLYSNGLQPKSLRTLGFIFDLGKNPRQANNFMTASSRISRRDLSTNLWLIENRVQKDDLTGALAYYDISMRTNFSARQLLFPTLLAATQYPEVQKGLGKYFRENVAWVNDFTHFSVDDQADIVPLASVIVASGGLDDTEYGKMIESKLLARVAPENPNIGLAVFNLMPEHNAKIVNALEFSASNVDPRFHPITWKLGDQGKVDAEVYEAEGGEWKVHAVVPQNVRSATLSRLLFLKPGRYTLSAPIDGAEFRDTAFARWKISCARKGDNTSLRTDSIGESAAGADQDVGFVVPPLCPAQMLQLVVFSPHNEGLELNVGNVRLK